MHASFIVRFEAIGTAWVIEIFEPLRPANAHLLEQAIHTRIAQFDAQYSRFRPDSLVATMARQAGTYALPPDAEPLLDLYHQLYLLTDGAFTPLIGQTLADAGYDATYTFQSRPLTTPPTWDAVLRYQYPTLELQQPALLDFGAAGKGYLVDLVATLLEQHGVTAYCVNAGGDLRYRHPATPSLQVGLEHPDDASQIIGIAELSGSGQSLCGSAGNRRSWGAYHHLLSPFTLSSPRHLKAAWVVAGSTLVADALATALFLVDPATLSGYDTFEYALIYRDYHLEHSSAFPATFFTAPSSLTR